MRQVGFFCHCIFLIRGSLKIEKLERNKTRFDLYRQMISIEQFLDFS